MDYTKNQKYFNKKKPVVQLRNLGLVLIVCSIGAYIAGGSEVLPLHIAMIIVGIVLLAISSGRSGISDSEYDSSVSGYAGSLSKTKALRKLGVDESEVNEIAPIIMGGYDFKGADMFKEGADKLWRSNVYKVIMLFFSRNELYCYEARFKTTEDKMLGESTDVYFYQDIVSVSTASVSDTVKIKDKEVTINSEAFRLTTKGGTSITVNILDAYQAEGSVNAMRALLREKKQA